MLQEKLFTTILKKHKTQAAAIQQVSELLFMNKSNTYRRITGEIVLKPKEIEVLVRHYEISLDSLLNTKTNQHLATHSVSNKKMELKAHLQIELNLCTYVSTYKGFSASFLGMDTPIHHYAIFPELMYFKSLQWNRLNWQPHNIPKADFGSLSEEERALSKEVSEAYSKIHTREIWHKGSLDIFLQQILYSYEVEMLTLEDSQLVLEKLLQLVDRLEKQLIIGKKYPASPTINFEVYASAIPLIGHSFIGRSTDFNYVTATFDPPNFIISQDMPLIEKAYQYFQKRCKQSQKISETGETSRRKLLNHFRRQIGKVERKIVNADR